MTEDDTFRRLRKPSYSEMRDIWATSELLQRSLKTKYEDFAKEITGFFWSYGWDVDDYSNYDKWKNHDRR